MSESGTEAILVKSPEDQVSKIYSLLSTALNAYCAHPETPQFNYAQITSAITAVLAVQAFEGGCNSEERLAATLKHFKKNLEGSIREIWKAEAAAAAEVAAAETQRKKGMQ